MLKETEEMRQARHALHDLSASDPAVSGNLLRHVAALSIMLTGRRGRERGESEPQVSAGFVLTHGDETLLGVAARRGGTDSIYLAFDVDDAAAAPVAIGVFRPEGERTRLYSKCVLWSPANDGRALLVPVSGGEYAGYFAHRPGRPLKFVLGRLPGDLAAGVRRATFRMERLLASDEVIEAGRQGFRSIVRNEGQELFANTCRAAA